MWLRCFVVSDSSAQWTNVLRLFLVRRRCPKFKVIFYKVRLKNCHSSGTNAVVGYFKRLFQHFIRKEKKYLCTRLFCHYDGRLAEIWTCFLTKISVRLRPHKLAAFSSMASECIVKLRIWVNKIIRLSQKCISVEPYQFSYVEICASDDRWRGYVRILFQCRFTPLFVQRCRSCEELLVVPIVISFFVDFDIRGKNYQLKNIEWLTKRKGVVVWEYGGEDKNMEEKKKIR
jgi:hypothetical protein